MKKVLIFFLVLTSLAGAAFSQEEERRLYWGFGFELGIVDRTDDVRVPGVPHTEFDTEDKIYWRQMVFFRPGNPRTGLRFHLELGTLLGSGPRYYIDRWGWSGTTNIERDTTVWIGLDLTLAAIQHMHLHFLPGSMLTVSMESQSVLAPNYGYRFQYDDWFPSVYTRRFRWARNVRYTQSRLVPAMRLTQEMQGMSVFGQAALPFLLFHASGSREALDLIDLDLTAGVRTDFGAGIEFEVENWIRRPHLNGMELIRFINITPSYELGRLYAEVEFRIPTHEGGMDNIGLIISPEVRAMLGRRFSTYLTLSFRHLGADRDTRTDMGVGIQWAF